MRSFCAFILTHGRPVAQRTLACLRRSGYAGRIILVLDDEDPTLPEYQANFPEEEIAVFDKRAEAAKTDTGDNFDDRRTVLFARNACFDLAEERGITHFVQLDDDYSTIEFKVGREGPAYRKVALTLGEVFEAFWDLLDETPIATVAMAQGGDFSVGERAFQVKRKAMNSFFCRTDRRFSFVSRLNDDVSTYLTLGSRGSIFLTVMALSLHQAATQSAPGGLTEAYLDFGTYVKSFYSVMFSPSCTRVGVLRDRIHHQIDWNVAVPKILREEKIPL